MLQRNFRSISGTECNPPYFRIHFSLYSFPIYILLFVSSDAVNHVLFLITDSVYIKFCLWVLEFSLWINTTTMINWLANSLVHPCLIDWHIHIPEVVRKFHTNWRWTQIMKERQAMFFTLLSVFFYCEYCYRLVWLSCIYNINICKYMCIGDPPIFGVKQLLKCCYANL